MAIEEERDLGFGSVVTRESRMRLLNRDGSFNQAFFFSVETFATIGYGNIDPVGVVSNMLMTLESLVGLLGVALATGIIFARFNPPTPEGILSIDMGKLHEIELVGETAVAAD